MARSQGDATVTDLDAAGAHADIKKLFQELETIDDPRQCVAKIRVQMAKFTAAGVTVPDDLVKTERRFQTECMIQSQGR